MVNNIWKNQSLNWYINHAFLAHAFFTVWCLKNSGISKRKTNSYLPNDSIEFSILSSVKETIECLMT